MKHEQDQGRAREGIAPVDARPHRKWRLAGKVLAYLTLAALAGASIWVIDRHVDEVANMPAGR